MRSLSPLRYPGGKGVLSDFLAQVIGANELVGCPYFEPYAGGAGAALQLLIDGTVSRIHINDADFRIAAFWWAVLNEADRFSDLIREIPLNIEEWRFQQTVCANTKKYSQFEVGFAAFYMNRCNRSGVLTGAGPIGGYAQAGVWKMDVRFSREPLAQRILEIAKFKDSIAITNMDAIEFLKAKLPRGTGRRNVFVYLDPPYVVKGQRLYLNAYREEDHDHVANYINRQKKLPWVMSYDDSELIRDLYDANRIYDLPIQYSLQKKRSANELIIAPWHLELPDTYSMYGRTISMS